ncbi:DsbA family protein [Patescibacteria group bacterium]
MKNAWKILAIALGALLIISLIWQYYTLKDFQSEFDRIQAKEKEVLQYAVDQGVVLDDQFAEEFDTEIPEPAPPIDPSEVSADDDPYSGNEDAKVSLIVFDDYECPFCAKMHDSVNTIRGKFTEEELKIVFRDFPLSFHTNAAPAARTVNAAGNQDKFFEMADLVYANQEELSAEKYLEFAEELGLDIDQFKSDMAEEELQAEIDKDLADAESYGVSGTPAVFLDGVQIGGFLEADQLEKKIREKL